MRRRNRRLGIGAAAMVCVIIIAACGSDIPAKEALSLGALGLGGNSAGSRPTVTATGAPSSAAANANGPGAQLTPGATASATASGVNGGGDGPGNGSGGGTSAAAAGPAAGNCAGFTDGPGITDSTITIANASDISGPIPGLFTSAEQATAAFVDYFNSTQSICGRKLKVEALDSETDDAGDQQAATSACGSAFAMVGSMSAFDDGGAQTVTQCGIPDLRAITTTPARADAPDVYGTDSVSIPHIAVAPFQYIKNVTGAAADKAALVYLGEGAVVPNAMSFKKAEATIGYNWIYTQAVSVTDINYAPYVATMRSKGVTLVQWEGSYQNAVRLKQAMVEQDFNPVFVMDSVAYDPGFISLGGSAVNGTYIFVDTALFQEAASNPEMQLYLHWLQQVAPGATPSFFGIFAWGAARLFTQLALQLGGRLTRHSLLSALAATTSFTSNGLFSTSDVGGKLTPACQAVLQLENGAWVRRSPGKFYCGPLVSTGVGT